MHYETPKDAGRIFGEYIFRLFRNGQSGILYFIFIFAVPCQALAQDVTTDGLGGSPYFYKTVLGLTNTGIVIDDTFGVDAGSSSLTKVNAYGNYPSPDTTWTTLRVAYAPSTGLVLASFGQNRFGAIPGTGKLPQASLSENALADPLIAFGSADRSIPQSCSVSRFQYTGTAGLNMISYAGPAGANSCGYVDGTGDVARFLGPRGIANECAAGVSYVIDTDDGYAGSTASAYVRKITRTLTQSADASRTIIGAQVSTLAGGPRTRTSIRPFDKAAFVDGKGNGARFGNLAAITCNPKTGAVYVIDSDFLRQISPDGTVTTIAGWGGVDSTGAGIDGHGLGIGFASPMAVSYSGGNFLIADLHYVRRVTNLPTISPSVVDVMDGGYAVTAHVFGSGATGRSGASFTFNVTRSTFLQDQSAVICKIGSTCPTPTTISLIDNSVAFTFPLNTQNPIVLGGRLYPTPDGGVVGMGFLGNQVSGVFGYWTAVRASPVLSDSSLYSNSANSAQQVDSGWYWNPYEGGRGYMVEQQGANLFLGGFLYDKSGAPVWYAAGPGPIYNGIFNGPFVAFSGGQTLTGAYKPPSQNQSMGSLHVDATTPMQLTWGGTTTTVQRFRFAPGTALLADPPANTPEAGWWWNPDQGGRGFGIEIQNGVLFLAGYMYDAKGNPVWYTSGPTAMVDVKTYQGVWQQFAGGQFQGAPYRAPSISNANAGAIAIAFSDTKHAQMTLPDGSKIPLVRFDFASDSLAQLYKARRGPDFEAEFKTVAQQIAELKNIEVLGTNKSGSTVNYLGYAWDTKTGAITYGGKTSSFLDALKCGMKGCTTVTTPVSTDPAVAKAKQCIAAYAGGTNSPQGDTLCQQAYMDECLDKATGTQTYKQEVEAVCRELTVYPADRCPYCPYRTLP